MADGGDITKRKADAKKAAETFQISGKIDFLRDLRGSLEAGEINFDQFRDVGQSLAQRINDDLFAIGNRGGGAARDQASLLARFQSETGFGQSEGNVRQVSINPQTLPQNVQGDARNQLLPDNISEEERNFLIGGIPDDISIGSDRFDIEREGVRQKLQAFRQHQQNVETRSGRLDELSSLLAGEQERQFGLNSPFIQEDLQQQGLLRSSALGESFGREQARLSGAREFGIAQQSLSDRDADIQERNAILSGAQGFQSAGLQRGFSLDDFRREAALARSLGQQGSGGSVDDSSRFNLGGATSGATGGALTGFLIGGPAGAAVGGTVGAAGGGFGGGK